MFQVVQTCSIIVILLDLWALFVVDWVGVSRATVWPARRMGRLDRATVSAATPGAVHFHHRNV